MKTLIAADNCSTMVVDHRRRQVDGYFVDYYNTLGFQAMVKLFYHMFPFCEVFCSSTKEGVISNVFLYMLLENNNVRNRWKSEMLTTLERGAR